MFFQLGWPQCGGSPCSTGAKLNATRGIEVYILFTRLFWVNFPCSVFTFRTFAGAPVRTDQHIKMCCTWNHHRSPRFHRLSSITTSDKYRPRSGCYPGKDFDKMINVCWVRWWMSQCSVLHKITSCHFRKAPSSSAFSRASGAITSFMIRASSSVTCDLAISCFCLLRGRSLDWPSGCSVLHGL